MDKKGAHLMDKKVAHLMGKKVARLTKGHKGWQSCQSRLEVRLRYGFEGLRRK